MVQLSSGQYAVGVCTHCFNIEVVGPGRDACLRCGHPYTHGLALTELAPLPPSAPAGGPPASPPPPAEPPAEVEFGAECPYCTGKLLVRVTETAFVVEADAGAYAAAAASGGEPPVEAGEEAPAPEPSPSADGETPAPAAAEASQPVAAAGRKRGR